MTLRPSRIRILLVEDSAIVRAGVATVLASHNQISIAAEAADAATALAVAKSLVPDVVLLDWRLPGSNGDSLCRSLRASLPEAGILVLTSAGDSATVKAAISAGADGYLLKDTDARTLADAVLAVAEGRTVFDHSLADVLGRLYRGSPQAGRVALSDAELRILKLISSGMTNKEIGSSLGLAEKTVKNQLTHIFETIGVRTRVQAATWWLREFGTDGA